ncbi:acetyl-CoA carboxylase biotin carboxyl carrier protein [Clostridium acetobutylicum]|uniref:Biotin carboxyl carrier protein n=2 Tax=Clostridium acetobutylicum TaxID=1488 RepID=Q97GS6_CLOAB|nr:MULTISPECIES: acetyl-CoA carboxylase biotin carboxyl carrier protein subunit [Clostridium]AAK80246.1 Biotin carboxyl carrier protein [Clostridium acetobutylicum ATCC 824]AEI32266.1 biotin carboxyl carrier protein [Clostridium acetobutylicum DSM 1731]ADZ21342.1 Biotin carboxyl carrier protein [Clostridium acetobutylicum EA 2018]AWV79330.1 acetyl-CoA carboxylase biotin carboxyl carrier protein subunit [Clostridium acetobutylicum]MBC2394699.1 acetyl-CoA carboxylase biotin carboxyl carrier prot
MNRNNLLEFINQMSRVSDKYINSEKTDFDKANYTITQFNDEICCTIEDTHIIQIKSLYVGTVNILNNKTNSLYVELGNEIECGQTLCTINHLKIPINIVSPTKGILTNILVKNKDIVQYGEILFEVTKK